MEKSSTLKKEQTIYHFSLIMVIGLFFFSSLCLGWIECCGKCSNGSGQVEGWFQLTNRFGSIVYVNDKAAMRKWKTLNSRLINE